MTRINLKPEEHSFTNRYFINYGELRWMEGSLTFGIQNNLKFETFKNSTAEFVDSKIYAGRWFGIPMNFFITQSNSKICFKNCLFTHTEEYRSGYISCYFNGCSVTMSNCKMKKNGKSTLLQISLFFKNVFVLLLSFYIILFI